MARFLAPALLALTPMVTAAAAYEVSEFTLDNGLHVVLIEDHRAPVVVQMLWYRAGAADEPPGVSGIAHYLEHLMFKATETRETGEFDDLVDSNGGSHNAFTSYDYTAYHQRIASDRLALMMEIEADRMRNLLITDQEIETERSVVLEERAQTSDSRPGTLLFEQMNMLLYQAHPYRIPVIGWEHEIETLERDDVFAFYNQFYAPNNATLVVAGDVTPDALRQLAEEHYGPIPPSPHITERLRPVDPEPIADRHIWLEDERVAEPYVVRSYPVVERNPGDQREAAALTLLSNLLSYGEATSVLGGQLVVEENRSLYTGTSYWSTTLDRGHFSIYNYPVPGVSLEEAEADLDRVLADFLEEGIDPEHLERIKFQWAAGEIYERDNLQNLAQEYGEALSIGLSVADVQAWPDIIASVTAEEVMQAARTLFTDTHSVTGYLSAPTQ